VHSETDTARTHWPDLPDRTAIEFALFDLGGVLVELTGVPCMMEWTRYSMGVDELWRRWLGSPIVRLYETGRVDTVEFADGVIAEFSLPVTREGFLNEFATWARTPYPGARPLLEDLAGRCPVGCLSNTNPVHWKRVVNEMGLIDCMTVCLASHETGLLKPDPEAYAEAARRIGSRAGNILFLDDNAINVAAARQSGMVAHRVAGLAETRTVLDAYNLT
jgi:putative hydrolase of the HAD superfamily